MHQIVRNQECSFWLENVSDIFSSGSLVPKSNDNFEEQMNSMTRFVMLVFIFLFFFRSSKYAISVSFLLILLISFCYYVGKSFSRKRIKEAYGNVPSVQIPNVPPPKHTAVNDLVLTPSYGQQQTISPNLPKTGNLLMNQHASNPQLIDGRQSSYWEYQNVPLEDTVSNNQKLAGTPNPKTLVQPVIPTPAYDNQVWQPNDFVVPSCINNQQRQELYTNGYIASGDTVALPNSAPSSPILSSSQMPSKENYTPVQKKGYRSPKIPISEVSFDQMSNNQYMTTADDLVDFGCGYQPLNLESNVPSNYMASKCQVQPNMKEYNKNLYSIPLQPGLYTKSQVNQPGASMSNLGISYNQQFLPTTFETDKQYQTFVELDPYQAPEPVKENYASPKDPFRRDIFDPRQSSYGTSYRSYVDPVTGQPRYYYRDIDQQTQNGYLTKNELDFAQFGTTTGVYPFDKPLEGQALHRHADNTYTESQIGYRTELQQRLMNKNSNRAWQQRVAPIYKNQQTKGFMGTNSSKIYAGPRGG